MSSSLQTKNPVIVSAFHTSLLRQSFAVVLVLLVLLLAWNVLRTAQYRRTTATAAAAGAGAAGGPGAPVGAASPVPTRPAWDPEPPARRVLRIGFGVLWVLDGLLQLQAAMPLGLPTGVLQPAGSSSPGWVQHVVNFGVTIWSKHPVETAVSAVWIQVGIGALLLVAAHGRWSRFAGLAAAGWGLVVWVFGEAFGGIFGQGVSWLFGAPGAVLFYCGAGVLVALPERLWSDPRLGRGIVRVTGLFFVGMAVLQAWPGRGFWQGAGGGAPGTLTSMARQMADTPQPGLFSSWVSSFAAFDAAHGWAVNLFVVAALGAIGVAFLAGGARAVRLAAAAAVVLCLADWVLVEDLGFFGGIGTDPNSMIPMVLVFVSGTLAMVRRPAPVPAPVTVAAAPAEAVVEPAQAPVLEPAPALPVAAASPTWYERVGPSSAGRLLAALGALAVIVVGAAPMALASVNPNADTILAVAANGSPNVVNFPAPRFDLVDQRGRAVSLADLHGKTVALTFLDPVCTSDCPVIAQEFRAADALLGSSASQVEFVAVVANPIDRTIAFTQAFDRQEGLATLPNWLYLTGTLAQLQQVWDHYGVQVSVEPAGAMIAHSDLAYLIDAHGHTREVLSAEPGSSSEANSSFVTLLSGEIQRVVHE